LQGGSVLHYKVDTTGIQDSVGVLDETIAIMNRRVDHLGIKEMEFAKFGSDEIKIQLPGVDQAQVEPIKGDLTALARLEFRIVATPQDLTAAGIDYEAEIKKKQEAEKSVDEAKNQGIPVSPYAGPKDKGFAWYYFSKEESGSPFEGLFVK